VGQGLELGLGIGLGIGLGSCLVRFDNICALRFAMQQNAGIPNLT
jgi:hypothetical protein